MHVQAPQSRPVVRRQHIGQAIRKRRKDLGWTLDQLAEDAGISASHLSRMERGQTKPSFTVAAQLAAALGIDLSDLAKLETENEHRDRELCRALAAAGWNSAEIEKAIAGDEDVKDRLLATLNGQVNQ